MCHRPVGDVGCRKCSYVQEFWHRAQSEHPELSREEAVLVGRLVAGLNESFVESHMHWEPTKAQLDKATDIAFAYFKSIGWVLPEK